MKLKNLNTGNLSIYPSPGQIKLDTRNLLMNNERKLRKETRSKNVSDILNQTLFPVFLTSLIFNHNIPR
jgi:hypothetical protein